MAKIDTTKIEGYENMTAEEKLAALESFEYEDNSQELQRFKNATSKANSEAAEWKRKHNALLSEEEQKKQSNEEELTNLRAQVEAMQKEKTTSEHKAKYLALGYDEALAEESAKALADGDIQKVFANQKKFIEIYDKNIKAELIKNTPHPEGGKVANEKTADEKETELLRGYIGLK